MQCKYKRVSITTQYLSLVRNDTINQIDFYTAVVQNITNLLIKVFFNVAKYFEEYTLILVLPITVHVCILSAEVHLFISIDYARASRHLGVLYKHKLWESLA